MVAGVQKAGSTTLYTGLREHPDIIMTSRAGYPFFFDENYEAKLDKYRKFFEPKSESDNRPSVVGDSCSAYFRSEKVPERLANALGSNLKLIFLLRHPLERAFSAYSHQKQNGYETRSVEEAFGIYSSTRPEIIREEKENVFEVFDEEYHNELNDDPIDHPLRIFQYLRNSLYSDFIENFRTYFPKENIKLVFLENLDNDPENFFRGITSFLKIDTSFVPDNIYIAHNKTRASKNIIFRLANSVKDYLPKSLKHKKLLRSTYEYVANQQKPKLPEGIRENLKFLVEQEIENLSDYTNQDLRELWNQ